ncbi:MAG: GNAT family N-acetyltransferase [Lachnospiraceae bacterium]|nr:GNAT family N-acetyltransferase [Lachnospiraceae bacterium]
MIRYLKNEEKQVCKELWEEAFPEDSREFVAYYFEEKVRDNRILALFEEGEVQEEDPRKHVAAMIHLNPYSLMVRGFCWKVDYLVGVATCREKRHRGYMRSLLLQIMKDLRQEQMPFCFLMPADEAIYKPFGFTYIYRQEKFVKGTGWERAVSAEAEVLVRAAEVGGKEAKTAPGGERDGAEGKLSHQVLTDLEKDSGTYQERLEITASWMNRWLERHYQVYARRDEAYVRRLVNELASEEGVLDLLFCKDEIVAMESWWGRGEREQRLIYGEEPYVKRIDGAEKPAIMARIISPEAFMPVIHLRDNAEWEDGCMIPLYIQDPLIEENDGLWLWHLNRETSWLQKQPEGKLPGQAKMGSGRILPLLTLKMEQLTEWLFGYQVPEEARPYEKMVETLQSVFLDEVV